MTRPAAESPEPAATQTPDLLLPSQYFAPRRVTAEGERRLLLAVLEEAIVCYQRNFLARQSEGRRLFRQSAEWLWDEQAAGPFSFPAVCAVLGLEPDYLRRELRRWSARRLMEARGRGRSRRGSAR
jgi:hypothetical protein